MYIADVWNNRIRKVTVSTSIISTIAGMGTSTSTVVDGVAATSTPLNYPHGVALDSSGNVYISEYGSNRIRKVAISTNIISTYAGRITGVGLSGDGGAATSATLYHPMLIALDSTGIHFISF